MKHRRIVELGMNIELGYGAGQLLCGILRTQMRSLSQDYTWKGPHLEPELYLKLGTETEPDVELGLYLKLRRNPKSSWDLFCDYTCITETKPDVDLGANS